MQWLSRHRWSGALVITAAMLVVALVASSTSTISENRPPPHVQATTTTTPLPTSTPAPQPGYAYYTDTVMGFQMQYPLKWQSVAQNPGAEFDDNIENPAYIMQVLWPVDSQDPTTDWVQYEMDNLRQTSGTTSFHQTDTSLQRVIGGETWKGGAAEIEQGNAKSSVLVFATIHNDHAYVINMLAADVSMSSALSHYFNPMLETFTFLDMGN